MKRLLGRPVAMAEVEEAVVAAFHDVFARPAAAVGR
jgi:hypothetical protein